MSKNVSSNKPLAQDADASRRTALPLLYLYPITHKWVPGSRSALSGGRLDALRKEFVQ